MQSLETWQASITHMLCMKLYWTSESGIRRPISTLIDLNLTEEQLRQQLEYFRRRNKNFVNIKSGFWPFKRTEINFQIREMGFMCMMCGKWLGSVRCLDEHQPFELNCMPICNNCFKVNGLKMVNTNDMELPPNLRSGLEKTPK